MRDNLKKAEDELIHVSKQRDYFRGEKIDLHVKHLMFNVKITIGYYERCCGRLHNSNLPLNLEMINNNHDQDFKTR